MKYTLTTSYRWVDTCEDSFIVKMYFIQDIPFTYDELPEESQENPEVVLEATASHRYSDEELYYCQFYLIEEQAHPLVFELDLVNPELLPAD